VQHRQHARRGLSTRVVGKGVNITILSISEHAVSDLGLWRPSG
jgi:hypothetical protein